MHSRSALASFVLAGASLFAQLAKPERPCPAGTLVPGVKGAQGFQPTKLQSSAPPSFPKITPNALEHLAYFTVAADGAPCGIYVIGEAADENVAAIVKALGAWRFAPAQLQGRPIATRASVSFNPKAMGRAPQSSPDYEAAIRAINTGTAAQQAGGIQKLESLSEALLPQADSYLGLMLLTGAKMTQDVPRGLKLIERAAAKEDRFAFYVQGMLYEQGKAVPKDEKLSAAAYEQAAARGMVLAQEKLGGFYVAGTGVAKDTGRAISLYRLCAAAGRNSCALSLATLLQEQGKFLDEALAWAILARNRGAQAASPLVQDLESKVPPPARLLAESFAAVIESTRPPR
jgi:hypothetical protein